MALTVHWKRYLLWFAHEHVPFRIPEIKSIVLMFNIPVKWIEQTEYDPYLVMEIQKEEDAVKLASRSVLVRSLFELYGSGTSSSEVHNQLKQLPINVLGNYCDQSFRIRVETFGKKVSREIKIDKIEELDFLPLKGRISLENPEHSFHLIEYYGLEPNKVPELPHKVFFGKWICDGQRRLKSHISLKKRKFIGNTSMDPTLSIIMSNMAKVQPNHLVLDPFVGSGSLLVPAAFFGAYVLGTDIDYLLLHGLAKPTRYNEKIRAPDESILNNLRQYNLESRYLDVMISDASLPVWRSEIKFNSIITDPPYGIREATERIGTHKTYTIPEHLADQHIPSKIGYNLKDVLCDLMNFSAHHLVLGGRLVFWMPVYKEDFSEDCIPTHPCLTLISSSEQPLTKHSSRLLLTFEKLFQPEDVSNKASVAEVTQNFRERYFQSIFKSRKKSS